ncbi:hypothetical protein [Arthrobacter agilis]|jgi:hypothetical protein|uniref:hypothetical protein n=1 Tax=Arthrobacter agilis TaxID=37921 RepID=UPI0027835C54|nr:hypothetical protein [Arthrobacter agilis]MDQ0734882.1 hypothetical protein [Arthrobacter agilis]
MTTQESEARSLSLPATPPPAPPLSGDRLQRGAPALSESDLKRQLERRRETERKLALHIQTYRETHPLPPSH